MVGRVPRETVASLYRGPMLRTILKAILIMIIVGALVYGVGFLLSLVNFGIATAIGAFFMKVAIGVGVVAGLWWGVNGGWTWTRE